MTLQFLVPVFLLLCSNLFMTVAWYWHLKFAEFPILKVILISWALAFIEYCFAVPANRMGYKHFSAAELKTIQEVITLTVFVGFSYFYLGEKITIYHAGGFLLILLGAMLIFNAPKS